MTPFKKLGLESRTISAYPISIGTSLALETLFAPRLAPYDAKRPIPTRVSVADYDTCYINIATLVRNLSMACDKGVFALADSEEVIAYINTEIEVIKDLFTVEGNSMCVPVFYNSTYEELKNGRVSKTVMLRHPTTTGQLLLKSRMGETAASLAKTMDISSYKDLIIPEHKGKSLIMSHVPYDLLSHKNFSKLDLLESHTGKLKTKGEWSSKLMKIGSVPLTNIPFCRRTLMIFGDKVLVKPQNIRLRQQILDVAVKRKWTSMTTRDKMNLDLSRDILDPFASDYINNI